MYKQEGNKHAEVTVRSISISSRYSKAVDEAPTINESGDVN